MNTTNLYTCKDCGLISTSSGDFTHQPEGQECRSKLHRWHFEQAVPQDQIESAVAKIAAKQKSSAAAKRRRGAKQQE